MYYSNWQGEMSRSGTVRAGRCPSGEMSSGGNVLHQKKQKYRQWDEKLLQLIYHMCCRHNGRQVLTTGSDGRILLTTTVA